MGVNNSMNEIREQSPLLRGTFERDSFLNLLKNRGLERVSDSIPAYTKAHWLNPIEFNGKKLYHRGHLLILTQLMLCNTIEYEGGLSDQFDFEDLVSRRACICELKAKNVREDIAHIEAFFAWFWGDQFGALEPIHTIHMKSILEGMLDELDPKQFFENLQSDRRDGRYLLVQELLTMLNEIEQINTKASALGIAIPTAEYLLERSSTLKALTGFFMPMHSPYLAVPTRDMSVEERAEFFKERNQLLVDKKYEELAHFYDSRSYLFDSEPELHSAMAVALGYIYGDLLKDSAKAAEAFQEALEYDISNVDAFNQRSHHLREAQQWPELIELLSNHWDVVEDPAQRAAYILECAQIQAFKCQNVDEALGLFERCMLDGYPGNCFDDLYKVVAGLMTERTALERMRALVTLALHIVNYEQCHKVEALQEAFNATPESRESFGACLSKLVDAGLQSFKGDQPQALEYIRDAILHAPNTNLIEGMLLRVASKMHSVREFREVMDDLESESLTTTTLSGIWLRVARVLLKLPKREALALIYAEKAVALSPDNAEAADVCYELATQLKNVEKSFIYASIKAARAKNDAQREALESVRNECKIALSDDAEKMMAAYETLLPYAELRDEVTQGIRELVEDANDEKAIEMMQRIEPLCMACGVSDLVGELYQSGLERDISANVKKGLLERYLGFMLGQGSAMDLTEFIPVHAQRYAMGPSDHLFTMVKTAAKDNVSAMEQWTSCLEDAVESIEDKTRVAKIELTLADCYQNILKDPEKEADAFGNLLKAAPDNVPAFKCCFKAYERLGRFFDCTEITKAFPHAKLSQQDRFSYLLKALTFALVHLYDSKTMGQFIQILAAEDVQSLPGVFEHIIEKARDAEMDSDQVICFFEQIEEDNMPLAVVACTKLARALLLYRAHRYEEVASLLDDAAKNAIQNVDLMACAVALVRTFDPEEKELQSVRERFGVHEGQASGSDKKSSSIDALVAECAASPEDDNLMFAVEGALRTLSPAEQTELCLKLGALFESHQLMAKAEDFFKRAFAATQAYDLLEFYKRNRLFKRAVKIMNFKLAKASDDQKMVLRLELAMLYRQAGNLKNAIAVLDDVIANKAALPTETYVDVLREKATNLMAEGRMDEAVGTLEVASKEAIPSAQKDEIDMDRCLILREMGAKDQALTLFGALENRQVTSDKLTLLRIGFDLDKGDMDGASSKIETLLASGNALLKVSALEQKLQLQTMRGDDSGAIAATAQALLALIPEHPAAKKALEQA